MRRGSIPTKLMVPAFLAVTACGGGGDDTGTASSTSAGTDAQTTTSTTTTATSSSTDPTSSSTTTTTAPTTTSDTTTGTDTGSDTTASGTDTDATTGGKPDCSQYKDVDACQVVGCVWESEGMVCIVDCTLITDQATCDMEDYCMWFDGTCYPPI